MVFLFVPHRRMFPQLVFSLDHLSPTSMYDIQIEFRLDDLKKYVL